MYQKIRFTSAQGSTAGLVVTSLRDGRYSVAELSRLYPVSEFRKMSRLEVSPEFESWDDAFGFSFPEGN